jgi:hypothetical protein
MTTKQNSFNVRISEELNNAIKTNMENCEIKTNAHFLEIANSLMPLYAAMLEKGLTVEQVIEKININIDYTSIVQIARKGSNQKPFEILKDKVMQYNVNCKDVDYRIELTPSLFYKIIGGNVPALKTLYESNEDEITKHNEEMGLGGNGENAKNNRKLAKRLGQDLYVWVKKVVNYEN